MSIPLAYYFLIVWGKNYIFLPLFYNLNLSFNTSDLSCTTIRVLNLGDRNKPNLALIEKRRQLVNALLWEHGINPDQGLMQDLEDDEFLYDFYEEILHDLQKPQGEKLDAFAPVAVSIIRSWLNRKNPAKKSK